jgi:hypothetical protein
MGTRTGLDACDEVFEVLAESQGTNTNYWQKSGTEGSGFF